MASIAQAPSPSPEASVAFIARLGRALHTYGSPAHRLEAAMELAARRLGLAGNFFSTPTALFLAIETGTGAPLTLLERAEPGQVHLEKLARLEAILTELGDGTLTPAAADGRLTEVLAAPDRYGPALGVLAFALASGSVARFLSGGIREMLAAALAGLLIGLLALAAGRFAGIGRLFEPLAALLAAGLATAAGCLSAAWGLGPLTPYVVTLAGLIVLLPGLTLTVAMTELAARHLVSGSARLAGAVVTFLTLAFGVALGQRGAEALWGPAPAVLPLPLPAWTDLAALVVNALALAVLFRAHPRDVPWIFGAAWIALAGTRLGSELLGPQLGAFLGAVLVGVAANLYGRLLCRPVAVCQLPGLMLLVPGSLGFRSLSSFLARDVVPGIEGAFQVTLVAVALVTGLLIANVLVPPRRLL